MIELVFIPQSDKPLPTAKPCNNDQWVTVHPPVRQTIANRKTLQQRPISYCSSPSPTNHCQQQNPATTTNELLFIPQSDKPLPTAKPCNNDQWVTVHPPVWQTIANSKTLQQRPMSYCSSPSLTNHCQQQNPATTTNELVFIPQSDIPLPTAKPCNNDQWVSVHSPVRQTIANHKTLQQRPMGYCSAPSPINYCQQQNPATTTNDLLFIPQSDKPLPTAKPCNNYQLVTVQPSVWQTIANSNTLQQRPMSYCSALSLTNHCQLQNPATTTNESLFIPQSDKPLPTAKPCNNDQWFTVHPPVRQTIANSKTLQQRPMSYCSALSLTNHCQQQNPATTTNELLFIPQSDKPLPTAKPCNNDQWVTVHPPIRQTIADNKTLQQRPMSYCSSPNPTDHCRQQNPATTTNELLFIPQSDRPLSTTKPCNNDLNTMSNGYQGKMASQQGLPASIWNISIYIFVRKHIKEITTAPTPTYIYTRLNNNCYHS